MTFLKYPHSPTNPFSHTNPSLSSLSLSHTLSLWLIIFLLPLFSDLESPTMAASQANTDSTTIARRRLIDDDVGSTSASQNNDEALTSTSTLSARLRLLELEVGGSTTTRLELEVA